MRVLIVYAHPNANSFNHAMLAACERGLTQAGHEIQVKNLYAEQFDPVLTANDLALLQTGVIPSKIQHEQQALLWAEGLIFIYPLWWYERPAILKGWFDQILTNGVAYTYSAAGVEGLLKHQKALVLITAGGSEGYFQDTNSVELIYRSMTEGTLQYCGIQNVQHQVYYNVPSLSAPDRQQILQDIEQFGANFAC
ncbi:MAG: NAD(P)H-dependent oxidoreductase [Thiotrichaceae bacterium]